MIGVIGGPQSRTTNHAPSTTVEPHAEPQPSSEAEVEAKTESVSAAPTSVETSPRSSTANNASGLITALASMLSEDETIVLKVKKTKQGVDLLVMPPAPDAEDECHEKAADIRAALVQPLFASGEPQQAETQLLTMLKGETDRTEVVARYHSLKQTLTLVEKAEAEAKKAEAAAKTRTRSAKTSKQKPAPKKGQTAEDKAEQAVKAAASTEKDAQVEDMFSGDENKQAGEKA